MLCSVTLIIAHLERGIPPVSVVITLYTEHYHECGYAPITIVFSVCQLKTNMARNFKLTMAIRKIQGDQPVFFKVDGGRFEAERTVKFNMNTKYAVDITVRPAQVVK